VRRTRADSTAACCRPESIRLLQILEPASNIQVESYGVRRRAPSRTGGAPGPAAAHVHARARIIIRRKRSCSVSSLQTEMPVVNPAAAKEDAASLIIAAISKGAPAYNAGDYEGCFTLYAATARHVLDGRLPPESHVRTLLQRQLDQAGRAGHPLSSAWELRAGFDGALVLLRGGSSVDARCACAAQLPRCPRLGISRPSSVRSLTRDRAAQAAGAGCAGEQGFC
jgi:hypothetical protein